MLILKIIILTLIIEAITVINRHLFGSMKKLYAKNTIPHKLRIHHGYIGAVLILATFFYPSDQLLIAGIALLLSDLLHHFVVLPLWIHRTEFP